MLNIKPVLFFYKQTMGRFNTPPPVDDPGDGITIDQGRVQEHSAGQEQVAAKPQENKVAAQGSVEPWAKWGEAFGAQLNVASTPDRDRA